MKTVGKKLTKCLISYIHFFCTTKNAVLYFCRKNDLTASSFDTTTSVSVSLYNFQEDEDTYWIKFVEPCPKVEWAGELNRDRHFVVNTEADDPSNLKVSVFNPNHGRSKFHNMTYDYDPSNRLQNVFLYYRQVGDLHWSKARTEITNEDGSAASLTIDFAAEYAYQEESGYGYSSLKWALANKVPDGTYEIRVETECDQLGGPADMDSYSTPVLSGIIDLTPPEQYGRALPLRDSVLIGEEVVVLFTEPVRPEAFDLRVTVFFEPTSIGSGSRELKKKKENKKEKKQKKEKESRNGKKRRKSLIGTAPSLLPSEAPSIAGGGVTLQFFPSNPSAAPTRAPVVLDRNHPAIQIISNDRKIGFQINPARINVEDWIGMTFEVEIGKINTPSVESPSNIFDLNGNAIEGNVIFKKTFADIDLDQASTSFTVTLSDMEHCSDVDSQLCAGEIKDKIASLMSLSSSDRDRIEVENVSVSASAPTSTVSARVKILPTKNENTRLLRWDDETININSSNTDHSVGLFRQLQSAVEAEQREVRALGAVAVDTKSSIVHISDMKILPSDLDMKLLQTDPEMLEEEEELYRYASSKGDVAVNDIQPILTKMERQAMVEELEVKIDEIDIKSKTREEAMMNEIEKKERGIMNEMKEDSKSREEEMMNVLRELKESKEKADLKLLRFELAALTLASVGISFIVFLYLRRN